MAEQLPSTYYKTPYKFTGKELDEETGLYYYGARYYDPRISVWLSVDPLMEKYPNVNPYVYCIDNPIRLNDPTGMGPYDVIIFGTRKTRAISELQLYVGSDVTLFDKSNVVRYKQNLIGPLTEKTSKILAAIDDSTIKVMVNANNKTETSDGYDYDGGAFMGNTVDPETCNVAAKQEVNPEMLADVSNFYEKPEQDVAHEITEGYEGAKLAQISGISTLPATIRDDQDENSVYHRSHYSLAVKQSGKIYKAEYDKKGRQTSRKTKSGTTEWSVKKQGDIEYKVIKTRKN